MNYNTVIKKWAKGKRMPDTRADFEAMAELYERALIRERDINGQLKNRINRLEQKLAKLKRGEKR